MGGKQKYKKVTKDVFPQEYSSHVLQSHNLKKFLFFCTHNPDKLGPIAEYIHEKVQRRVKKRYHGHVLVAMELFGYLLEALKADEVALLGNHLSECLALVLSSDDDEVVQSGAKTFAKYLKSAAHSIDCSMLLELADDNRSLVCRIAGVDALGEYVASTPFDTFLHSELFVPIVKRLLSSMTDTHLKLRDAGLVHLQTLSSRANAYNVQAILELVLNVLSDDWESTIVLTCLRGCFQDHRRQVARSLAFQAGALSVLEQFLSEPTDPLPGGCAVDVVAPLLLLLPDHLDGVLKCIGKLETEFPQPLELTLFVVRRALANPGHLESYLQCARAIWGRTARGGEPLVPLLAPLRDSSKQAAAFLGELPGVAEAPPVVEISLRGAEVKTESSAEPGVTPQQLVRMLEPNVQHKAMPRFKKEFDDVALETKQAFQGGAAEFHSLVADSFDTTGNRITLHSLKV